MIPFPPESGFETCSGLSTSDNHVCSALEVKAETKFDFVYAEFPRCCLGKITQFVTNS